MITSIPIEEQDQGSGATRLNHDLHNVATSERFCRFSQVFPHVPSFRFIAQTECHALMSELACCISHERAHSGVEVKNVRCEKYERMNDWGAQVPTVVH
jgi:hypothetical protein